MIAQPPVLWLPVFLSHEMSAHSFASSCYSFFCVCICWLCLFCRSRQLSFNPPVFSVSFSISFFFRENWTLKLLLRFAVILRRCLFFSKKIWKHQKHWKLNVKEKEQLRKNFSVKWILSQENEYVSLLTTTMKTYSVTNVPSFPVTFRFFFQGCHAFSTFVCPVLHKTLLDNIYQAAF